MDVFDLIISLTDIKLSLHTASFTFSASERPLDFRPSAEKPNFLLAHIDYKKTWQAALPE